MKATGIVRRIDDLGRVVIPKEIRKVLRIREGDPLEIYTSHGGEVILKKYSPINELGQFADEYAQTAAHILASTVVISDTDQIVAVSGCNKSAFMDKKVDHELDKIMQNKTNYHSDEKIIIPILSHGDAIGSVTILPKENRILTDTELKAAEIGATFLAKQMEN
ncbi:MAG: stage V sporulation T C-terminal domain-containing protein [Anaerovoracaceae bacterium]